MFVQCNCQAPTAFSYSLSKKNSIHVYSECETSSHALPNIPSINSQGHSRLTCLLVLLGKWFQQIVPKWKWLVPILINHSLQLQEYTTFVQILQQTNFLVLSNLTKCHKEFIVCVCVEIITLKITSTELHHPNVIERFYCLWRMYAKCSDDLKIFTILCTIPIIKLSHINRSR